jgi:hypothetical protein
MPHVFHDVFFDDATDNAQGLWPYPGNHRTVGYGQISPFKSFNPFSQRYVGYYVNTSTVSGTAITIITYTFDDPIDLSDIIGFRVRYDLANNLSLQLFIILEDSSNATRIYTTSAFIPNTGFTYNQVANPGIINLTNILSSSAQLNSLKKIIVSISSNGLPQYTLAIYSISTLYNASLYYSPHNLAFRDTFQLPQPSISSGSHSVPYDNTIVALATASPPPSPSNRDLSITPASSNITAIDFSISSPPEVHNGLLAAGNSPDDTSTITVDYRIHLPSSPRAFNILIPYYTLSNNTDNSYTIRVLLLSNSREELHPTLLTQNISTSAGMTYNYILDQIQVNPPRSAFYLRLEISNIRRFSTIPSYLWIQFIAMAFTDDNAACILEDTRILLSNGQWKKVQDLKRGDSIAGKDGSALPLCRLITKDISTSKVEFILIPKDAISPGLPINDLYCCKHHYFLYNDKLYAAESFLSFPGTKRITGYGKQVLSKPRMYDLQFETEGFYIAEGLLCPSRSPYDADDPLPRELFFDQSLFRPNIPKSQLDHLLGFPISFSRISLKAKWNWRKFLEDIRKQGIKVSKETYEEALRIRKALRNIIGDKVKVLELEYEE